jgi:hypothetical protein
VLDMPIQRGHVSTIEGRRNVNEFTEWTRGWNGMAARLRACTSR